jgi:drug/metabolite transporter (DMT)-like permease
VSLADPPVPASALTLASPRVFVPFIIVSLIWSSTWIVIRDQLGPDAAIQVPPSWSVTYRFIVGAIAMFAVIAAQRRPVWLDRPAMGLAAIMGLMQFSLNFNFVYRAEHFITSGLVAVIFALLIVPNTVMGRIFLKTPMNARFLAGASVAVIGIILLMLREYRVADVGGTAVLLGGALTFAGVMSASTANVLQGGETARQQDMFTLLAWAMVWGTLFNAIIALVTVGAPIIDFRPGYIGGVLYLGIAASAITFPLYFGIIRAVGPGSAAWSSVLIPIIAMGISTVFEDYRWSTLAIAGAVLSMAGLVIALKAKPA